jgi:hypothetical protein
MDRRVDIDDHLVTGRARIRSPRPLTRPGAGCRDPAQLDRPDMIERTPHRRFRRDRTEHGRFGAQRGEIRQTRRAVRGAEHHGAALSE